MEIQGIQNFKNDLFLNNTVTKSENTFEKFFNSAVGLLKETNQLQIDSQNKQIDFVTGKSDDIISLSMAQSRASSAIQFTSQVTNKILSAYQEIMRISI